jgi:hypothetical protein
MERGKANLWDKFPHTREKKNNLLCTGRETRTVENPAQPGTGQIGRPIRCRDEVELKAKNSQQYAN